MVLLRSGTCSQTPPVHRTTCVILCSPDFQVVLNVIANIAGFAFAVAAIVLYSENLADLYFRWICEFDYYSTKSPWQQEFQEKCREKMLLTEVSVKSCLSHVDVWLMR